MVKMKRVTYNTSQSSTSEYKNSYSQKMADMESESKYYESNPEKHPNYDKEWKSFWERRYKEIKRAGKDPDNYNYSNDWKIYWTKYAKDYHEERCSELKKEISQSTRSSPTKRSSQKKDLIVISDDSSSSSLSSNESRYSRSRKRRYRDRKSYYSSVSSEDEKPTNRQNENDNESINLVSVLRLLSALDSELGILATKVIDMLSRSLELERVQANSSEMLLNSENVIFLETMKEKLKGLVAANLMSEKKIIAAKKCIQNIAKLIHQSASSSQVEENNKISALTAMNKIDADKLKLAEMIARELEAHGKTDYTPDELEVIIEIYLEDKSKSETSYENFSDDDLRLLIGNFKDLSEIEQHHLIKFLQQLEQNEPERVEKLQSVVVNLVTSDNSKKKIRQDENANRIVTIDDDDDDDYNFDELVSQIK